MSTELQQIDKVTITMDGGEYLKERSQHEETVKNLEVNNSELWRLSQLMENMKGKVTVLSGFVNKFLDEFEGAFDRENTCASPEIARDYLDAAIYMRNYFGRKTNRIDAVKDWYDNYLQPPSKTESAGSKLAAHVLAMADDAYLIDCPEWHEIVFDAQAVVLEEAKALNKKPLP